jgi:CBS domain-containing protein
VNAAALFKNGAELIVVCRTDRKLVGIVTKSDLLRVFVEHGLLDRTIPVCTAMQTNVVSCTLADSLETVWNMLSKRGFRHLPVLDTDGRTLGVLNARDILGGLLIETESEEEILKQYVMGIGYR